MPIETACPGCGRMLRVPDTHAGAQARCPQCETVFTVPAGNDSTGPADSESVSNAHYPQPESDYPSPEPPAQAVPEGQIDSDNPYASPISTSAPEVDLSGQAYRPHRGGMILTFGILGVCFTFFTLCCGLSFFVGAGFSIAAWAMGHGDLAAIRLGHMDRMGYGTTQAGVVLGIIGTILAGLAFVGTLCFFLFAFLAQ